MPSAVYFEKARQNMGPEDFKNDLVRLAGAVDRYTGNKIGPVGAGYALKGIQVLNRRNRQEGASKLCAVEYEATLSAVGDVMISRPPYLEGQEFTPLVENNQVNWDNFDRFYKAYLERDTAKVRAVAATFNGARQKKLYSKGESQVVKGSMTFEKTENGWKGQLDISEAPK